MVELDALSTTSVDHSLESSSHAYSVSSIPEPLLDMPPKTKKKKRRCLCGSPECRALTAAFGMLEDFRKKFVKLPSQPQQRAAYLQCLTPTIKTRSVALHHFSPTVLRLRLLEETPRSVSELITKPLSREEVPQIKDWTEVQEFRDDFGMPTGKYFFLPNYIKAEDDLMILIQQILHKSPEEAHRRSSSVRFSSVQDVREYQPHAPKDQHRHKSAPPAPQWSPPSLLEESAGGSSNGRSMSFTERVKRATRSASIRLNGKKSPNGKEKSPKNGKKSSQLESMKQQGPVKKRNVKREEEKEEMNYASMSTASASYSTYTDEHL